jgi:hypothetical protein
MSKFATIKIDKNLLNMPKNMKKAVIATLEVGGESIQAETVKLPASKSFVDRTGNLRASVKKDRVDKRKLNVKVTSHADYSSYVNDGTYDKKAGGKGIAPREFMDQGLENATGGGKIENILVKQLAKHNV